MLDWLFSPWGWFTSFWVLWIMFINLAPYIKSHEDWPLPARIGWKLGAGIFYVGEILWNIVAGSVLFWLFDTIDGRRNKQGLPQFKGIDLDTTWKLTITYRLNSILESYPEDALSYRIATFMGKYLINPWDPKHIRIKENLARMTA